MKKTILIALLLLATGITFAQKNTFNKITPELLQEVSRSSDANEKFQVIIIMNEQLDAQKTAQRTQFLGKEQQREFVVTELQQLAKKDQQKLLDELHQGEKATLVDNVKPFWIINAIGCSMTENMIHAIADRPEVMFVMKDSEIFLLDGEDDEEIVPDRATNHWNITKVNADDVWALGYTGSGVIVAVIDSGVNYNHNDIKDNMWDGGEEYPYHGWDFVNNDNDPIDDHGHGSHCAGTVASRASSNTQYGIAKDAVIMALKTLNNNGSGSKSNSWSAIEFAVSNGADILSMSYGSSGTGGYWDERTVMEHVLRCGVVAAVAAGNDGNKLSDYPIPCNINAPGNCPSPWHNPDQASHGGHTAVICVGSTNSSDQHASSSSIGPVTWTGGNYNELVYSDYPWESGSTTNTGLIKPDISAPGVYITSLDYATNNGYSTKSGTSMATPCVAGVMALMLSVNPMLSPLEIDSIIETTATRLDNQTTKNNTFGAGRIDALAAVNYMLNVCEAPTELTATVNHGNVNLIWQASTDANSYRIYRNGVMIADAISDTTYNDVDAPAGNNTYFIRGNGNNDQASLPSNQVTITNTTNTFLNTPESLMVDANNNNNNAVVLTWEPPKIHKATLCYTTEETGYMGDNSEIVAAQKFPSSMLQAYAGMEINTISFSVLNPDVTCSIKLYEGDALLTGDLIYDGSATSTESRQTIIDTLDNPIAINPNKDLWLTISTSDALMIYNDYNSSEGNNAFLVRRASDNYWISHVGRAWTFQIGLSESTHTYNVYKNGDVIAQDQSSTSYTDSFDSGINTFQVTSVTNGYESKTSNSVTIIKGQQSLSDLSITTNDKYIILPTDTLIVSGTITNTDPANLVIEEGGQLIHPNCAVQATLKKTINAYSTETGVSDGWYTIASPIVDYDVENISLGDYDLYAYDEKEVYWRNQKVLANNITEFKEGKGFLYANAATMPLVFAGSMKATNEQVTVTLNCQSSNENLKGFNLLGNPFSRNLNYGEITLGGNPITTYYSVEGGAELVSHSINTDPIKPGQGFLVQATSDGQALVFNPSSSKGREEIKPSYISIEAGDESFTDRAIVQFGEGNTLYKTTLGDNTAKLSLWHHDANYATVIIDSAENELPLNFKAIHDGSHTLSVSIENLDLDYLHLIDNIAGADINLLVTPSYSFEARTDDYPSRFRLLFSTSDSPNIDSNDIDGGVTQIFDMTGRLVGTDRNKLVPGIYIIRTINGNEVKTEKIVVKGIEN